MKILIIGQCTLHWGRMEFGNIGNFYIIEPFVRELHRAFPNSEIKTTLQMSEAFCKKENIEVLPMKLYYNWDAEDLDTALIELASARMYHETGYLPKRTAYIDAVLEADLVIDFSGDIWGDNADFLGDNRFFVGLCKDRVAQLLGKKTVMLAGSPGPFDAKKNLDFAKEVYSGFDLVTNREAISIDLLKDYGFEVSNTKSLACPAFLFEPAKIDSVAEHIGEERLKSPVVGFVLCGWNFTTGPFDKWPREDEDYIQFAQAVEYIETELGASVCLMSHSNGFHVPPAPFKAIHGRDYPVIKQLEKVVNSRGIAKKVFSLNDVYDPWVSKAIISQFDMLVSGRIHAAVAGLSQNIPTVIIDYGHEPKAHKLKGFAQVAGVLDYVADPAKANDLIAKIGSCWNNRVELKNNLQVQIPLVKNIARQNFDLLKELV